MDSLKQFSVRTALFVLRGAWLAAAFTTRMVIRIVFKVMVCAVGWILKTLAGIMALILLIAILMNLGQRSDGTLTQTGQSLVHAMEEQVPLAYALFEPAAIGLANRIDPAMDHVFWLIDRLQIAEPHTDLEVQPSVRASLNDHACVLGSPWDEPFVRP